MVGATVWTVWPSPKNHVYPRIVPSGSEEPEASNVHVAPLHTIVSDSTGGALASTLR